MPFRSPPSGWRRRSAVTRRSPRGCTSTRASSPASRWRRRTGWTGGRSIWPPAPAGSTEPVTATHVPDGAAPSAEQMRADAAALSARQLRVPGVPSAERVRGAGVPGVPAAPFGPDACDAPVRASGPASVPTAPLTPVAAAALRRFLDYLAVERGLAANTLSAYRRDLHRYAGWLAAAGIDDPARA